MDEANPPDDHNPASESSADQPLPASFPPLISSGSNPDSSTMTESEFTRFEIPAPPSPPRRFGVLASQRQRNSYTKMTLEEMLENKALRISIQSWASDESGSLVTLQRPLRARGVDLADVHGGESPTVLRERYKTWMENAANNPENEISDEELPALPEDGEPRDDEEEGEASIGKGKGRKLDSPTQEGDGTNNDRGRHITIHRNPELHAGGTSPTRQRGTSQNRENQSQPQGSKNTPSSEDISNMTPEQILGWLRRWNVPPMTEGVTMIREQLQHHADLRRVYAHGPDQQTAKARVHWEGSRNSTAVPNYWKFSPHHKSWPDIEAEKYDQEAAATQTVEEQPDEDVKRAIELSLQTFQEDSWKRRTEGLLGQVGSNDGDQATHASEENGEGPSGSRRASTPDIGNPDDDQDFQAEIASIDWQALNPNGDADTREQYIEHMRIEWRIKKTKELGLNAQSRLNQGSKFAPQDLINIVEDSEEENDFDTEEDANGKQSEQALEEGHDSDEDDQDNKDAHEEEDVIANKESGMRTKWIAFTNAMSHGDQKRSHETTEDSGVVERETKRLVLMKSAPASTPTAAAAANPVEETIDEGTGRSDLEGAMEGPATDSVMKDDGENVAGEESDEQSGEL